MNLLTSSFLSPSSSCCPHRSLNALISLDLNISLDVLISLIILNKSLDVWFPLLSSTYCLTFDSPCSSQHIILLDVWFPFLSSTYRLMFDSPCSAQHLDWCLDYLHTPVRIAWWFSVPALSMTGRSMSWMPIALFHRSLTSWSLSDCPVALKRLNAPLLSTMDRSISVALHHGSVDVFMSHRSPQWKA